MSAERLGLVKARLVVSMPVLYPCSLALITH